MGDNTTSKNKRLGQQTILQSGQETVANLYDGLSDAAASVCAMLFPELRQTALQPVVVRREERHVWIGL